MIEALVRLILLHEMCGEDQGLSIKQIRKIMSAIQELSTSINAATNAQVLLATAITSAISQLGSASDPQLIALRATVESQNANIVDLTARLNAALSAPGVPVVTTQPSSQSVPIGGSATFISVASGDLPLSYQWQFNEVDMPGETNANLTISNAQTSNAGDYTVRVTNSAGSDVSAPATVTIE